MAVAALGVSVRPTAVAIDAPLNPALLEALIVTIMVIMSIASFSAGYITG